MSSKLVKMALAVSLASMCAVAPAEDIDLFTGGGATDLPNVLFILDNTANWNTPFTNEIGALKSVLEALPEDKFKIGLMMFNSANSPGKGAHIRAAIRLMNETNKGLYKSLVNSFDKIQDNGSNALYGLSMAEAYEYFRGSAATAGAGEPKRDYTGNTSGTAASNAIYALAGNAFTSAAATTYTSPLDALKPCAKNYIIFISNGPVDNNDKDATNNPPTAKTLLQAAGGNTTTITLSPNSEQTSMADEWARYLAHTDVAASAGTQNVVTYTVDVNPGTTGQGPSHTALLRSMAGQGLGKYFSVSSSTGGGQQIADALTLILSEIQSVNSAFAAASLPVSVNTQGTYLNQVFIGMFRPESAPRWFGNMKQYQLRADADATGTVVSLRLVDKTNNLNVINSQSGFVVPCVQSFWTTANTYWPTGYLGSCLTAGLNNVRSDSPDGEIVEKGAAAQRLRAITVTAGGTDSRNVLTCSGCGDNSGLVDFSTGTASISALGLTAGDTAGQSALVKWARGQNVDNELSKGTAVMRPSVHGDVVHSRPLAIDYGGGTGVVVFYGSNDGMLHAINGKQADTDGNELWAFVAPEHYDKFKRLRSNSPIISFPNAAAVTPAPAPKDYFFDGPIGMYHSGSSAWIYPTMRRGGSAVYAFNVSTPASPTLKWKRDGTQLANLGQTWSEPKVVKVAGYGSGTSPVIIMGGGYDTCEDQDAVTNTACSAPKGNRVFVLDADTGALLKTFTTDRSVPADVTAVDNDGDGLVDMAYAVDTDANIYRIDIGTAAPGSWTISKIAALGCGDSACGRKFLQAPEVVRGIAFNAILVGSGNRERPLLTNQAVNVDNAFFMIKDDRSVNPTVITTSSLVAIDPNSSTLTDAQKANLAAPANKGWYLAFGTPGGTAESDHDKEQVVTAAVVIAGKVYFSTHQPTEPTACGANLGTARGYAVSYLDASTPLDSGGGAVDKYSIFRGGGLSPSPVAGVALIKVTNPDGSVQPNPVNVPFIIGGGGGSTGTTIPPGSDPGSDSGLGPSISGLDPSLVGVNPSGVRGRVYWFIQQ